MAEPGLAPKGTGPGQSGATTSHPLGPGAEAVRKALERTSGFGAQEGALLVLLAVVLVGHQIPRSDLASCVCSHSYTVAFPPVPACIFSTRSFMKTGPAAVNGSPPLSRGSTIPMPLLALSPAKDPTCSLLCKRSASSCNSLVWSCKQL